MCGKRLQGIDAADESQHLGGCSAHGDISGGLESLHLQQASGIPHLGGEEEHQHDTQFLIGTQFLRERDAPAHHARIAVERVEEGDKLRTVFLGLGIEFEFIKQQFAYLFRTVDVKRFAGKGVDLLL